MKQTTFEIRHANYKEADGVGEYLVFTGIMPGETFTCGGEELQAPAEAGTFELWEMTNADDNTHLYYEFRA